MTKISLLPLFPLLIEKEKLVQDHWINDAQSMNYPDGKVTYFFKYLD